MKIHLFVLIVNFSKLVSNLNFDSQTLCLQGITEEVGGDEGGRTLYSYPQPYIVDKLLELLDKK